MSRKRAVTFAGIWLGALLERYPLVPPLVLLAGLIVLPPVEVALLVGGTWIVWRSTALRSQKTPRSSPVVDR